MMVEDWRDHVDQLHVFSGAIESCMRDTRGQLERLTDDISRTLEKIASRERYVNQQLHYQLNGLKYAHDRRAERKETYRQASVGLNDNTHYLAEVCALHCTRCPKQRPITVIMCNNNNKSQPDYSGRTGNDQTASHWFHAYSMRNGMTINPDSQLKQNCLATKLNCDCATN